MSDIISSLQKLRNKHLRSERIMQLRTIASIYRYEFCLFLAVHFSYQGIKHQSIKCVAVRVLHHDVEQSIQSVLQELNADAVMKQGNNKS